MTECRCGRPTRDQRYYCEHCADELSRALGDVAWLAGEVETTITRQKAAGFNGGSRSAVRPLPWNDAAAEALRTLHGILVSWVRFCVDEDVRHQSHHVGLPVDHAPALSRWLMWRVDGLALLDIGPEAVEEITDAVAACHRVIDRKPDRLYLGACECGEQMFATRRHGTHKCRACAAEWDIDATREALAEAAMDAYDGKLFTASEAAQVLCAIGQAPDTDPIRLSDRIRKWATPPRKGVPARLLARGQVRRADQRTRPAYRLDDIRDLLAASEKRTA